jgi:hypothetical protein
MSETTLDQTRRGAQRKVKIRTVAIPAEHGGWAFILTPILLALLVAPSLAGLCLGISAFAGFLLHHPLKTALKDWRKGRRLARTRLAEKFALGYGLVAGLAFLLTLALGEWDFLLPLLLALPLALVQLYFDARNQSRALLPEMAGVMALAATGPAIVLLAGWSLAEALALWGLLAAWAGPTVVYIRQRLRLEHGKAVRPVISWAVHGVALLGVLGLVGADYLPLLGVIALLVLAGRMLLGLSARRKPARAVVIGIREVVYAVLFGVLSGVGFLVGV